MEITSFVLGMLTIVAVIILTVIVVGMVKIINHSKQIKNIYSYVNDIERHIHDRINDEHRRVEQSIIDTHRDINMVEGTLKNQIDQARQETGKAVHTVRTDLSSYIDSRIDKVVTKGTLDGSKQILNG
jgi:predicted PurR-regulated permease PerM